MSDNNDLKNQYAVPVAIVAAAVILAWGFTNRSPLPNLSSGSAQGVSENAHPNNVPEAVASPGVSIRWGDLGQKLASVGVIDRAKWEKLYTGLGGGRSASAAEILDAGAGSVIAVTEGNAGVVLNALWALGLGNKSSVLEKGEMTSLFYGGAGGFASTAGWTLSAGGPMEHYARHRFLELSPAEEALVEEVSKHIYRPCCDNPTHFPDCNHGMAMLGFLELLASQGATEKEMYDGALQLNSLWFPDAYAAARSYLSLNHRDPGVADPKELLSFEFSSATGSRKVAASLQSRGGAGGGGLGGCGVGAGGVLPPPPAESPASEGSCGV